MIFSIFGALAAVVLIVLPGSWLAFGLPLAELGFWSRLICGILLSPAVLFVQFTVLRWAHLPFGRIAFILTLLNLPAAWLVLRADRPTAPKRSVLLAWIAVMILPLAFLALWMHNPTVRANWAHGWLHTDMIYMLANGGIRPEDPQLAGVPLAYPWLADLFNGLTSYMLDRSPNWSFIWINSIWLVCTLALVAALVEQLGGTLWACASSVIFLCFGVNAAGFVLSHVLPRHFVTSHRLWGDGRYSPWVRKFGGFAGTSLGIALVAAVAVVVTRRWGPDHRKSWWALVVALMIGLALSYPVLFPVGALLVGARLLVGIAQRRRSDSGEFREIFAPLIALVLGCLTTAIWLHVVTIDRVGTAVVLRSLSHLRGQATTMLIVLAPLLLGVALSGFSLLKRYTEATVILLLTAAGCMVAYVLFNLNFPNNEYKFVLTAAVCLTPFAAIAWEDVAKRIGRWALPTFAVITLGLAVCGFQSLIVIRSYLFHGGRPRVDVSHFAFGLQPGEPFAALGVAVRTKSPENSILLTGDIKRDLITLTQRPLFIPYEANRSIIGILMTSDAWLNRNLGYDPKLINRRRTLLHTLYETSDDEIRTAQLEAISAELRRPMVIVVDEAHDSELAGWLARRSDSALIYSGEGVAAWSVRESRSSAIQ